MLVLAAAVASLFATSGLTARAAAQSEAIEFADWTSVDTSAEVATGTLRGRPISLTGSNLQDGAITDGSSPVFSGPSFSPPLPLSDALVFAGFPGYSYVLRFGEPTRDPVLHLATLASTLEFPPGTPVTKVSGEPTFTVSGSSVSGVLAGSTDANGTVRLNGVFETIPFTATPVYPPSSEDGIFIQVGSPPPLPPDLGLSPGGAFAPGALLAVAPGGQATLPLVLQRNATSTGRVALSVTGLPAGVTASLAPAELGGTASSSTLTLSAAPGAAPVRGRIAVVATPVDATAGVAARVLEINVIVQGALAVEVEGIEVTQAVQTHQQPRRTTYDGVALVTGKKTVVRVFADLVGTEISGRGIRRPQFGMALFATDPNGRPKPGSPLFPEWRPDPATLALNDGSLTEAERNSATSAFTFVLPDAWTRAPLRLEARAVGSSSAGATAGSTMCVVAACGATPSRTLTGITFRAPPAAAELNVLEQVVVLHDAAGRVTGLNVVKASPAQVFAKLLALSPVPFHFLDGANRPAHWPRYRATRFASDSAILEPATAWDEEIGRPGLGTVGVYVLGDNPGVKVGRVAVVSGRTDSPGVLWRPVTSVAHEVFHQLGFAHASTACGAGDGEPWPVPNGRMDSVGIDTTPGSGGAGAPYRIIADTDASPAYDLMGYCGIVAGDAPHWISARNWNRAQGVAPPPRVRVLRVRNTLSIRAAVIGAAVQIGGVAPAAFAAPAPSPSPYVLAARDIAGRLLATVPVSQSVGTGAAGTDPVIALEAQVPAAGVARVEILTTDGTVVASRSASATAPRLRVLSPARGARVGAGALTTVRWRASDADADALEVAIDFSPDGGRTYRNVWAGPSGAGSVRLRTELLDATPNARLRLRANDGFRTTTATSAPFVVVPRRPTVEIIEPVAGQRADAGGAVRLLGAAVDSRGRELTGRRLTWRAGRTVLGRGASVSAVLPAGTRRVVLEATDASGRTGSDSVAMRIRSATPFFLRLEAPPIPRAARTAVLIVSATQPSSLAVRGRRHDVGPGVRRIRVPVAAGRGSIRLRVVLSAGGRRTVSTVVVRRR